MFYLENIRETKVFSKRKQNCFSLWNVFFVFFSKNARNKNFKGGTHGPCQFSI